MAIITTNGSFGATAAVTSTTLNAVADAATFVSGAVDGTSLELISGGSDNGKLGIKDAGVTTAKVADSSSKTTGVTFAKMQHISTAKVLGRTSASEGDVEEVDLLDQDDMSSNSATSVATQQSIKAYVDASSTDGFTPATVSSGQKSVTLPNGLIMKFGTALSNSDAAQTFDFTDLGHTDFPNECINLTTGGMPNHYVTTLSETSFIIDRYDSISGSFTFYWQAIGR